MLSLHALNLPFLIKKNPNIIDKLKFKDFGDRRIRFSFYSIKKKDLTLFLLLIQLAVVCIFSIFQANIGAYFVTLLFVSPLL